MRAENRHHAQRKKDRVRRYRGPVDAKEIGKCATTPQRCSCEACGNQRDKATRREAFMAVFDLDGPLESGALASGEE